MTGECGLPEDMHIRETVGRVEVAIISPVRAPAVQHDDASVAVIVTNSSHSMQSNGVTHFSPMHVSIYNHVTIKPIAVIVEAVVHFKPQNQGQAWL